MSCPHQFVYSLGEGEGHCLVCHSPVRTVVVRELSNVELDTTGAPRETYRRLWQTAGPLTTPGHMLQ